MCNFLIQFMRTGVMIHVAEMESAFVSSMQEVMKRNNRAINYSGDKEDQAEGQNGYGDAVKHLSVTGVLFRLGRNLTERFTTAIFMDLSSFPPGFIKYSNDEPIA